MSKVAYNITEAATETSLKVATIEKAIRDGSLHVRVVGSERIITHTDLLLWAEGLPSVDEGFRPAGSGAAESGRLVSLVEHSTEVQAQHRAQ